MWGLGTADHVDVGNLASSLLSTYPDYSRKKINSFRMLVGKVYQSLLLSNQFENQKSHSKVCSKEEDWLEQRERDHLHLRMDQQKMELQNDNEL